MGDAQATAIGPTARLTTPPLGGTILPGVTRDTLITLARDAGYAVDEERTSINQWREGCARGELTEVFACGTAARITLVGKVVGPDTAWRIADTWPVRSPRA